MYPLQLWGWGINHHTHIPTWEPTAGNVTPCSRKFLIIAEIRLSCGSLRKSSAHSTIRAFSFSQTLGWPWRTRIKAFYANTDQKWTFLKKSHIVGQHTRKWNLPHTLFKTLLTSLANSLEHTSKWKIFPQFETQAPRSCEDKVYILFMNLMK